MIDSEWPTNLHHQSSLVMPVSDGKHRPASHPLQRHQTAAEAAAPPKPPPDPPPDPGALQYREAADARARRERWDGERRERWNAYMRQYRLDHPDYVAAMRERDRQRQRREDDDYPRAASGAGE